MEWPGLSRDVYGNDDVDGTAALRLSQLSAAKPSVVEHITTTRRTTSTYRISPAYPRRLGADAADTHTTHSHSRAKSVSTPSSLAFARLSPTDPAHDHSDRPHGVHGGKHIRCSDLRPGHGTSATTTTSTTPRPSPRSSPTRNSPETSRRRSVPSSWFASSSATIPSLYKAYSSPPTPLSSRNAVSRSSDDLISRLRTSLDESQPALRYPPDKSFPQFRSRLQKQKHSPTMSLSLSLRPLQQVISISIYTLISLLAGLTLLCILATSYGLTFADDLRGHIGHVMLKVNDVGKWMTDNLKKQAKIGKMRRERRLKQGMRDCANTANHSRPSIKPEEKASTGASNSETSILSPLRIVWVSSPITDFRNTADMSTRYSRVRYAGSIPCLGHPRPSNVLRNTAQSFKVHHDHHIRPFLRVRPLRPLYPPYCLLF